MFHYYIKDGNNEWAEITSEEFDLFVPAGQRNRMFNYCILHKRMEWKNTKMEYIK